ncbi:MAG: aminoglycoside phosphotransferase, partial [Propionibacteriaceae bacterium]
MREPPAGLSAAAVAEAVEAGWSLRPATAVHLPVGFGAHHWRVSSPATTVFATLDVLTAARDAASFEEAYAAAAALAGQGLDLVVAPRPTVAGGFSVPLGAGRLSCTP